MINPFRPVMRLLNRWALQQETALLQMAKRKTAGERLSGYSKSERVEAKFFLLALAPFVPVIASDMLGWTRGLLWYATCGVAVVWAVFVLGFGFVGVFRALRRL